MAFQRGNPGRPPGSRNKRTLEFLEVLEDNGFCPAQALIDSYKIAMKRFTEEVAKEDEGRISPMESNAAKYLKIASDNASDLASYAYPKLKSIERQKIGAADHLSVHQKLDAARLMVKLLEDEAKGAENGQGAL